MYWLVEPHADDVFLSLHQHIVGPWKETPKTIVTIFADKKRRQEAAAYAEAVGCSHLCLCLAEGGSLSGDPGHVPPIRVWGLYKGLQRRTEDRLVIPLGIQHPDHRATVEAARGFSGQILRYLDTPYYTKLKLAEELQTLVAGREVESIVYASKRKWRHVPLFKSQAKFFYYNSPEFLPRIEVVLR